MITNTHKVPLPGVRVFARVYGPGRILKLSREIPVHSWVRNFYRYCFMFSSTANQRLSSGLALQDLDGQMRDFDTKIDMVNAEADILAAAGDDTAGIIVGDDDTPEYYTDYNLYGKINHGALSYGVMAEAGVSDAGDTRTVSIVRSIFNNTGSSVTVREMGLAVHGVDYSYLWFRSVLDSPITLSDAEELELTFLSSLQYPQTIS